MIYLCKKLQYVAIASKVTGRDLKDSKLTLHGFMCHYFEKGLNLLSGTITEIKFK